MKTTILAVIFCTFFGFSQAQSLTDFRTTDFISLPEPMDYNGNFNYLGKGDTVVIRKVSGVPHNRSILSSFSDLCSVVTIYQQSKDGMLSLSGSSLSKKDSTYVVIYEFAQSQCFPLPIGDTLKGSILSVQIGVSVRMEAKVITKKSGISLVNLFFGLGLTANKLSVSGKLAVKVSGINSQTINALIPVTSDLTPTSIENALQSVAAIKSHMHDTDMIITPKLLAFGVNSSNKNEQFDFIEMCKKMYPKLYKNYKCNEAEWQQ